jgi:hypothetical protein
VLPDFIRDRWQVFARSLPAKARSTAGGYQSPAGDTRYDYR